MLAGSADLDLANELVPLVGAGRELVPEVGLAVLLASARLDILLPPLRCRPVGGIALAATMSFSSFLIDCSGV